MQDFNLVIGRAVLDENFRAQVFSNPHAALQGFNLSPEQFQTLQNMSLDQFNNLVQQFGEELGRGDTFMKACATGQHIKKAQLFVRKAGGDSADYFQKADLPGVDYFQKADAPGEDTPPHPGNQAVGLVVIAIIAILIGMLLPASFAPTDTVKGALHTMGFTFDCLPAVQMADGSVMPAAGAQVAVGDVNGDGVNGDGAAEARRGRGGRGQQEAYLEIKMNDVLISSYQRTDDRFDFGDIIVGLNDTRLALGGESFLPPCDATSDPQEGGEMTVQGDEGGTTGGTTGGGQPAGGTSTGGDQPTPDDGLCANNGGIQWQGQACVCPGLIDNVTTCADGTKIDQVTDQTCVPDQSCDQPTEPQNPPSSCPCTYVCVEQVVGAAAACNKYAWRDCTGAACTPPTTP